MVGAGDGVSRNGISLKIPHLELNQVCTQSDIRGDQISHIQKVWGLREASQIGQTFIPMRKSCLKHSTAEFQSIQQFWLQLDIVSCSNKEN